MKELSSSYYLIIYPVVLLCAATITWVVIPSILHVSRARRLYDDLGHFRKQHDHGVPRLGGIAIFVSFTITSLLFAMQGKAISINYLYTACTILFAMGIKDDLAGVHFSTKFVIQFLVALVLVLLADIRLTSMYGVLGIYALPYWPSVALSILTIILIVNAFNLIDGIDGLAATTGIIVNATFAGLFIYMHQYQLAAVALTITGAVIGFLKFNITPAKIFMGDTGSLLIGLISVVMAIRFIELNQFKAAASPSIFSAPALSVAILIGPVFDSIRVFVLRICNGVSPFSGDRNHIHHRVVNLGFSHMQATVFLATMNLVCIAVVFLFQGLGNSVLLGLLLLICLLFNWGLSFFTRSAERNKWAFRSLFN